MAAFEIEGKIIQKLAKSSGQSARGSWSKQEFVLEYQDGSYPAQVCFTAFGDDKVAELGNYSEGDSVKVSFNLRAREYNGRWYNDIRVWKLTPAGASQPSRQQAYAAAPAPSIEDMPAENDNDDLPF